MKTEPAINWLELPTRQSPICPIEIVERKGIGHPDSLCDGIAERISVEYSLWCRKNLDASMHHNFDKVQLVAGEVSLGFGRGELLKPLRIQVAGRATHQTQTGILIPVKELVASATRQHIKETLRYLDPDKHCLIECYAGKGSGELVHTVLSRKANDTSFGVAHWPLSSTEQLVYDLSQYLNEQLLHKFPIGEDTKVMGVSRQGTLSLTCAMPFLALEIQSLQDYQNQKLAVAQAIEEFCKGKLQKSLSITVNAADDFEAGQIYLSLTGTAAEMGDDGAVGRGNRITGVIAPFHPASLEATAGKNPFSHTGKLYNVLALLMCQAIVSAVQAVQEVQIVLVSQIGQSLDEPLAVAITIKPKGRLLSQVEKIEIEEIVKHQLSHIEEVTQKLLKREIKVY